MSNADTVKAKVSVRYPLTRLAQDAKGQDGFIKVIPMTNSIKIVIALFYKIAQSVRLLARLSLRIGL
jgi:hypothetical protein